ncbi:DNA/RNA polymerase [Dacryopinax primogenitus]|uniref:DNA polymerase kappa n=1 Tax=Dacryopinax primogenitus (strain DJM 731) TaxID=1858805 RepID=M5G259_DACPD|nr:DNA/RNA polymerase [Dacryopinax primogenitus]EJU04281.1 DNA/RNA polymerase [Dacryopinax primogenitus]
MAPSKPPEADSLVKRLAGPSTNKAGLAQDQSEINRIIAEASKGSKFYENEKRKDEELTARINRLLEKRDSVIKGVDLARLEKAADQILIDMEARRDLTQIIVHVDADAFYASVEVMDNPDLKGKGFGVGGGVLTTASYEARKCGVRSAMPMHIAKKLYPELIIVPCRFSRYSEVSKSLMSILRRYDPTMNPAGFDEAYLNITQYCSEHELGAEECVQVIRDEVHKETGLTISAGIAPNKPSGQFMLPFDRKGIVAFMKDLSVRKVPGIGRVNERILEAIGVKTCGDIYTQRAVITLLDHELGLHGLLHAHLGIGSNVVEPHIREERKSVGVERTFRAVGDSSKLMEILENIAESLEEDCEQTGWAGKTLTLKYKLHTYEVFTRARSLNRYIRSKEDIFSIGSELLRKELPLTVRLLGLRLTHLKDLRDKGDRGIKRFFKDIGDQPPSKRNRLNDEDAPSGTLMEDDVEEIPMDQAVVSANGTPNPSPSREGQRFSPNVKDPPEGQQLEGRERLICPVCSTSLLTDNDGLNAHMDYCLSRGTIAELATLGSQGDGPITPNKKVPCGPAKSRPAPNPFLLSKRK